MRFWGLFYHSYNREPPKFLIIKAPVLSLSIRALRLKVLGEGSTGPGLEMWEFMGLGFKGLGFRV